MGSEAAAPKLYLLDTNDAANTPVQRGITSELYGGDRRLRLEQELVLGIGGWHLLEALGIKPQVCHLNEGHAAFAILERANSFMIENHVSFEVALNATRAGTILRLTRQWQQVLIISLLPLLSNIWASMLRKSCRSRCRNCWPSDGAIHTTQKSISTWRTSPFEAAGRSMG